MKKQTNNWFDIFLAVVLGLLEIFILFLALKWIWAGMERIPCNGGGGTDDSIGGGGAGAGAAIAFLGLFLSFIACAVWFGLIYFQIVRAKKDESHIAYWSGCIAMFPPSLCIVVIIVWLLLSPLIYSTR